VKGSVKNREVIPLAWGAGQEQQSTLSQIAPKSKKVAKSWGRLQAGKTKEGTVTWWDQEK